MRILRDAAERRREAWSPDSERRASKPDAGSRPVPGGTMDVMEWWLGVAVVVGVVVWLLVPRENEANDELEPFEHPAGPETVFCELCRDWHPPGNHAGER